MIEDLLNNNEYISEQILTGDDKSTWNLFCIYRPFFNGYYTEKLDIHYYRYFNTTPIETDVNGDVYIICGIGILSRTLPQAYIDRLNDAFQESLEEHNIIIITGDTVDDIYKDIFKKQLTPSTYVVKTGFYPNSHRAYQTSDEEFYASIAILADNNLEDVFSSFEEAGILN